MNAIINFLPEVKSLEEAPVVINSAIYAWHVVAFDKNKKALGGGLHHSKETARRIALAEVSERKLFKKIIASNEAENFLLTEFPTTCGFAAGFENDKTRMRAIAEGIERWVWSKWIDEHYMLSKVEINQAKLSPISNKFAEYFDSIILFKQEIDTSKIPNFVDHVEIGIVIGIKGKGVFPGSRVAFSEEELWDHAFIEAWRHLEISKSHDLALDSSQPYDRIMFFAHNAQLGLEQINKAYRNEILCPEPLLILEHSTSVDGLYLWRSLMKDFIGWHVGNEKRFVY